MIDSSEGGAVLYYHYGAFTHDYPFSYYHQSLFLTPPPHRSPSEEPAADRILDEQLIPMLGSVMVLICSGGMPCPGRLTGQSLTNGHVK